MTVRLAKLYVAFSLCCLAFYLFWLGVGDWLGVLSTMKAPFSAGVAAVTSLVCLGLGGMLGWKTVLEELAVTSD